MNLKNCKIVKKLKDISPRLKWAMYSKIQECKIASRYIDFLIPDENKEINKDNDVFCFEEYLIKKAGI